MGKLIPWAARRHEEEAQSKSAFVLEVGSEEMLSKDAGDGGWKNDQRTVRLRGGWVEAMLERSRDVNKRTISRSSRRAPATRRPGVAFEFVPSFCYLQYH